MSDESFQAEMHIINCMWLIHSVWTVRELATLARTSRRLWMITCLRLKDAKEATEALLEWEAGGGSD